MKRVLHTPVFLMILCLSLLSVFQQDLYAQVSAGNNSPVCIGSSVQLTSNFISGGSYYWQGPNGFTSSAQNPWIQQASLTHAGLYTLIVTVNTQTQTDTTRVHVLQSLVVNAGSNSPVCTGATLQFSAQPYPNASYSWSGPNGFFAGIRTPSILNAQSFHSGNYSVTISMQGCPNASGVTSVTVSTGSFNIQAGSNSPVCSGNTLTMSASNIQGATYQWAGPVGYSSTQQTATLQNAQVQASGIYTVTVSHNNCTANQTLSVHVNPAPQSQPGSNSPVCAGSTLFLTSPSIQGGSYFWTGPNGFSSNIQNPTIQNTQSIHAGVYTLTVHIPGCPQASATTSVTINQTNLLVQAGSNSPVCAGSTLFLSVSSVNGASYHWTGPNGFTSNIQNPVIQQATVQHSGIWQVVISNTPCGNIIRSLQVQVNNPPQVIAGNNGPVCAGNTLHLTSSWVNSGQYSWQGPNGFSSTLQSPSISNAQSIHAGVYTLTLSVPGCNPVHTTTNVVVNPSLNNIIISAGSNSPICSGQTLFLSVTTLTGATYFWTGPNGYSTNQQNPIINNVTPQMSGTYYVVISNTGCGNITRQVFVSIHPSATALASSNSPLCTGQTLQLSTPFVQNATYLWFGPNGFSSNMRTPSIGNVTLNHAGIYTVNVNTPGCGNANSTVQVIVNSGPNMVMAGSNSPVCTGATLNLSATTITGASYFWTGPNGFTSNQQNPAINNVTLQMAGGYYVVISNTGCGNITRQVSVTIHPSAMALASSNSPLCTGQTLQLSTPFVQGATYLWLGPNGFSSNMRTPSIGNVTLNHAGIYTVNVNTPGCGNANSTVQVIINSGPNMVMAGSNSPVCTGSTLNLSATSIPGANYFWTGPNGFTSNQQNPVRTNATLLMSGAYYVVISNTGCGNITRQISVTIHPSATALASSNSPLCTGQTLQLSTPFIQGATYLWSGPNGFSSGLQAPSIGNVTLNHAGNYTVTVSTPGCGNANSTVQVIINSGPNLVMAGGNSPVCIGGTLNLSATTITGASYFWSGPNGYTSNQQNPVLTNVTQQMAGLYYVAISNTGCGTVTRQVQVFIHPAPIAQASSNSPLCTGQTLLLSTPFVQGANYLWSGPNGFSSNLQAPSISNVTLNHAGNYTVTVSTTGCGNSSSTVQVIINSGPNMVMAGSNSPVCIGGTLNLSATTITGANYFWTGPNGFTSNQQNPVRTNVTLQMAGGYYVVISNTGCGNITRQLSVIVHPSAMAQASSNSPLCTGQTLQLSTPFVQGANYLWSGPNGFSSNLQAPSISNVTLNHAGTYTVTVHTPGCGNAMSTVQVVINSGPNVILAGSNSPICIGGSLNLSATTITGAGYFWSGPNGYTSNQQNPVRNNVTQQMAGLYYVAISNTGCGTVTRQVQVFISSTPIAQASSNSPLCTGQTLQLSTPFVQGANYLWSGPNGFSSGMRTPSIGNVTLNHAGTYTVNVHSPGCGNAMSTTQVIIHSGPNTIMAGSNSPICTGGTLNLSATTITGAGYFWSGPNGYTSNQQNPVLNNVTQQMTGIYYVAISNTGCGTVTRQVQVFISPTPIAQAGSNSPLCTGQTLQLSTPFVQGANYLWSGPNGFSSGMQTPFIGNVNLSHAGNYTVIVNTPGCGSILSTTQVTINSGPNSITAGSNSPVCTGSSLFLSVITGTGANYAWTGPNGFTSNLQNPVRTNMTTAMGGVYQVVVSNTGCGNVTRQVYVIVNDSSTVQAIAMPNPVCSGSSLLLSASGPGNTNYLWTGPMGYSVQQQVAQRFQMQNSHAGIYTLNANVPGCGIVSRFVSVSVIQCRNNNTENHWLNKTQISVFPNPFTDQIKGKSEAGTIKHVYLIDVQGRVLGESEINSSGDFTIHTLGLSTGMYFLRIETSDGESGILNIRKE